MKRNGLMLLLAGSMLAGCSKTEVTDVAAGAAEAVGFDTHVGKTTRADLSTDNIRKFYLFGSYVFGGKTSQIWRNTEVTRPASGGVWRVPAGDKHYWIDGAQYTFVAYAGPERLTDGQLVFDEGMLTISGYEISNALQSDLCLARAEQTGVATNNPAVSLNFRHLLSKVRFTFISGLGDGVTLQVSSLAIYNFPGKATYTMNNRGVWMDWDYASTPELTYDGFAPISTNGGTSVSKDFYLIPYDGRVAHTMTASFSVTATNREGVTVIPSKKLKVDIPLEWMQNTYYNCNLTVNGASVGMEEITFTVDTVEDWTSGNAGDIDVTPGN